MTIQTRIPTDPFVSSHQTGPQRKPLDDKSHVLDLHPIRQGATGSSGRPFSKNKARNKSQHNGRPVDRRVVRRIGQFSAAGSFVGLVIASVIIISILAYTSVIGALYIAH